jgi:hypothetical protein
MRTPGSGVCVPAAAVAVSARRRASAARAGDDADRLELLPARRSMGAPALRSLAANEAEVAAAAAAAELARVSRDDCDAERGRGDTRPKPGAGGTAPPCAHITGIRHTSEQRGISQAVGQQDIKVRGKRAHRREARRDVADHGVNGAGQRVRPRARG